jgi:hypothetical protein
MHYYVFIIFSLSLNGFLHYMQQPAVRDVVRDV